MRRSALFTFLIVSVLGVAADLGTKGLAERRLEGRDSIVVVADLFELEWSVNEGAAFGMFQGRFWLLLSISAVAALALAYFAFSTRTPNARWYGVFLGLVNSGVFGNLYDRVALGHVRDFILVYIPVPGGGLYRWPNFNIADAAICVGAAALVILFWRDERRAAREAAAAGTSPSPPPSRPS